MSQTVEQALAAATLYTDNQDYILIKLPTRAVTAAAGVVAEIAEPFSALLVDKDEVTLLIPDHALSHFASRLRGHTANAVKLRLITFDVELEPTLTGFIAKIAGALAEAGIPIFPLAAYTRDHLFVPADQFESAMNVLNKLRS